MPDKEVMPLITDEEMCAEIWDLGAGLEGAEGRLPTQKERFTRIAQAQRDADLKVLEAKLKIMRQIWETEFLSARGQPASWQNF